MPTDVSVSTIVNRRLRFACFGDLAENKYPVNILRQRFDL
jgi:hypothetical protein